MLKPDNQKGVIMSVNEIMDNLHSGTPDYDAIRSALELMESMTIKVEKRRVYGNDLIYIKSAHAEAIKTLTGKLTIDKRDIEALKTLGFDVEVIAPEL
jgi:hypothetical protein